MAFTQTYVALSLVKARLNMLPEYTVLDDYLTQRVQAAVQELARIGIALRDTDDDLMLVVDYTVWQYQNRDAPGSMPEWLRLRRRERWIHIDEEAGT